MGVVVTLMHSFPVGGNLAAGERVGKFLVPFAVRCVAGHSDGYPNIDPARISCAISDRSVDEASGVFHMARIGAVLSICQSGIQAGFGGSMNHSYFGPFMISDKRNVSGGRGTKSSSDDKFAGCCFSLESRVYRHVQTNVPVYNHS